VASAGSSVASIADVELAYAPNASPAAVSPDMKDVIKDALRAAGTMRAILSRTALSPADQARAMFQGLVRSPGPLSANVANQLALYPAAGDAVINIFTNMTAGGTIAQAGSNAASIMAAMEQEIRRQGPGNVSAHCADPASASVADLPLANFSAAGRAMFRRAIGSRARLTDEADAFHLELTWQQ
jgi:hypothetical protein